MNKKRIYEGHAVDQVKRETNIQVSKELLLVWTVDNYNRHSMKLVPLSCCLSKIALVYRLLIQRNGNKRCQKVLKTNKLVHY